MTTHGFATRRSQVNAMNRYRSVANEFRTVCFLVVLGFGISLWLVLWMGDTHKTQHGMSKIENADKLALSQFLASPTDPNCENGICGPDSTLENSSVRHDMPILVRVSISPESRVRATAVDISPKLAHQQWAEYVIAIENAAGVKSKLSMTSDQFVEKGQATADRWLRAELISNERLSGEALEYRTLRLWSFDAGKRAAVLAFNVGQGTQDLGFRSDVLMLFEVR
jgi:hypothetical protein